MRRQIDTTTLQMALVGYEAELARVNEKMAAIRSQIGAAARAQITTNAPTSTWTLSAAARKRIAMAQKARWKKFHAEHGTPAKKTTRKKRTLSPAVRAKLAANLAKARAAKAGKVARR